MNHADLTTLRLLLGAIGLLCLFVKPQSTKPLFPPRTTREIMKSMGYFKDKDK